MTADHTHIRPDASQPGRRFSSAGYRMTPKPPWPAPLNGHYARAEDEASALIREALTTSGDIIPPAAN